MTLQKVSGDDRLMMEMSYRYWDPHVQYKTVSRPSYIYHGNPFTWEKGLHIETGAW